MKPLVLVILDGWGYSTVTAGNPIIDAHTPTYRFFQEHYPMLLLQASGVAVGQKWGDVGNSEVGHLTIGAGRTVTQHSVRIERAIKDGTFYDLPALKDAFEHGKTTGGAVHIAGLLTSGSVHAEFDNLLALVTLSSRYPGIRVFLHLFTDGKDSGLQEGASLLEKLLSGIATVNPNVKVATLIGRDFAMDRDHNWELTQKSYDLIASAQGVAIDDPLMALKDLYAKGQSDMNVPAMVISDSKFRGIQDGDALIFFNFREDSMRQILRSFGDASFNSFPHRQIENFFVSSMTRYCPDLNTPFAFSLPPMIHNLPETVSLAGIKQLHVAETQKYAHVTYFFNGLKEGAFDGESDLLLDSHKKTLEHPEMRAIDIVRSVIAELSKNEYGFLVVNLANADMLAHTGNYEATRSGIETIDLALRELYDAILTIDATLVITSDHGNAEKLVDRVSSEEESRHDSSPVPLMLIGKQYLDTGSINARRSMDDVAGILADVAPTVLDIMSIPKPAEMSGESLLPKLLFPGT